MNRWVDDIRIALSNLGGVAHRSEILEEVIRIRPTPHPDSIVQTIQRTIQNHSSDSVGFRGPDIFYTVKGIGSGIWGLRSSLSSTPTAIDLPESGYLDVVAPRFHSNTYRVLRDTELARKIKALHQNKCQLCEFQLQLANGLSYAEAHHIQPLGMPHNGPDIAENIVVLCPNHHVMLDYGVCKLDLSILRVSHGHTIGQRFIDYHNQTVWQGCK